MASEKPLFPRHSTRPLPPYTHVPGQAPHPISDPQGHMRGRSHTAQAALEPTRWRESEAYLYAIDLFNHGYFWESHEAWESLWLAAGRAGPTAIWLKALIKLAAANVKRLEGNPSGRRRHALRAIELQNELQKALPPGTQVYCGIALAQVEEIGEHLAQTEELPTTAGMGAARGDDRLILIDS